MTDLNKKSLLTFAKVIGIGVPAFIALITFSGVLNAVVANGISSFYGWAAGINLIIQGFGVYSLYKKFFPRVVKESNNK